MSKHTEGPWVAPSAGIYSKGGLMIATVNTNDSTQISVEEVVANARLIAAAPELLSALKAFVDPWNAGGKWESKITYDTYNNARTAIAKAEGGA